MRIRIYLICTQVHCFLVFADSSTVVKSENIPLNAMMGMEYPSLQQLTTSMTPPHAQLLNPIDRLYSMQNSYFCSLDGNQPGNGGGNSTTADLPLPTGHMQHHSNPLHLGLSSTLHDHHQGSPVNNGTATGGEPSIQQPLPVHHGNHGHPLNPIQQHPAHQHTQQHQQL